MLKGKAVPAAKIPVTVLAMEWKIHALPAESTVLMKRGRFLPESFFKECNNGCENSHKSVIASPGLKTFNPY